VALVLETVGVERDAIFADFLRSNAAVPQLRAQILDTIRNRAETPSPEVMSFAEARITDEVLGVREEYLDAAQRTIDAEFGSSAKYLAALGVTPDEVSRLRESLLG
jgi:protein-tyrosine phosphatase